MLLTISRRNGRDLFVTHLTSTYTSRSRLFFFSFLVIIVFFCVCLREKCWPRSSHSTPFSFIFIFLFFFFGCFSLFCVCVLLLGRKTRVFVVIFLVLSPSNVCSSLGMEWSQPVFLFFSKVKDTGEGEPTFFYRVRETCFCFFY